MITYLLIAFCAFTLGFFTSSLFCIARGDES
jgi:hypothetical protein